MRVKTATVEGLVRAWLVLASAGIAILAALALRSALPAGAPTAASLILPIPAAAAPRVTAAAGRSTMPGFAAPLPRVAINTSPVAARPFTLRGVSIVDRARALQCLTAAIYYEAGAEPQRGQRAVAQTVLNRVRHPAFPATVCGVVYQGIERGACQFSFACDGTAAHIPSIAGWARAARIAADALAGYVFAPVGLATHYHSYAVAPRWARGLVMTDLEGAHLFHRWPGGMGTPAAFVQRYAGGERSSDIVPAFAAAPTLAASAPGAPRPVPADMRVMPAAVAAAPPPAVAMGDRLPPAPTVLDRWKDAGKPL